MRVGWKKGMSAVHDSYWCRPPGGACSTASMVRTWSVKRYILVECGQDSMQKKETQPKVLLS